MNLYYIKIKKERLILLFSVFIYIVIINLTYYSFVTKKYYYMGFGDYYPGHIYIFISFILAIFPAITLPTNFFRPSLLFYYCQYFLIYIPFLFISYYCNNILEPSQVLIVSFFVFLAILIMQAIYRFPLVRIPNLNIGFFWFFFIFAFLFLILYIQKKFGGGFKLADLTQMYQVRAAMRETASASGEILGLYFQGWLANVFLPFLLAISLFLRKKLLFVVIGAGYLYLYGICGSKATLFAMVYISGVYFLLKLSRDNHASVFSLGLVSLLVIAYPLKFISENIFKWYVAIVHMRTFSIPTLLLSQYYDFFSVNNLTFMSHVTGINYLIQYPFDRPISFIIGEIYLREHVNSNAGFWASDGIAGLWLPGIILISVICSFIFYLIDSISCDFDPHFVGVSMTCVAVSFINTPLFTTVFTGGIWIFLLLFSTLPRCGFVLPLVTRRK